MHQKFLVIAYFINICKILFSDSNFFVVKSKSHVWLFVATIKLSTITNGIWINADLQLYIVVIFLMTALKSRKEN